VGAQGPPARRSAGPATVAARARVPPMHYLDKPQPNLGATKPKPGVQFLMSKRVQFRMSVDTDSSGSPQGHQNGG
jgi:hypothetical protein